MQYSNVTFQNNPTINMSVFYGQHDSTGLSSVKLLLICNPTKHPPLTWAGQHHYAPIELEKIEYNKSFTFPLKYYMKKDVGVILALEATIYWHKY